MIDRELLARAVKEYLDEHGYIDISWDWDDGKELAAELAERYERLHAGTATPRKRAISAASAE